MKLMLLQFVLYHIFTMNNSQSSAVMTVYDGTLGQ